MIRGNRFVRSAETKDRIRKMFDDSSITKNEYKKMFENVKKDDQKQIRISEEIGLRQTKINYGTYVSWSVKEDNQRWRWVDKEIVLVLSLEIKTSINVKEK